MIGEYKRQVLRTNSVFNQRYVRDAAKLFNLTEEHSDIILNSMFYYFRGVMKDPYDYRRCIMNGLITWKLHKFMTDKTESVDINRKRKKYENKKAYYELVDKLKIEDPKNVRPRWNEEYDRKFIKYYEDKSYIATE